MIIEKYSKSKKNTIWVLLLTVVMGSFAVNCSPTRILVTDKVPEKLLIKFSFGSNSSLFVKKGIELVGVVDISSRKSKRHPFKNHILTKAGKVALKLRQYTTLDTDRVSRYVKYTDSYIKQYAAFRRQYPTIKKNKDSFYGKPFYMSFNAKPNTWIEISVKKNAAGKWEVYHEKKKGSYQVIANPSNLPKKISF